MGITVLQEIFGGKAAEAVMLFLYHYGEGYGRAISRDFNTSLDSVQKQLDRYEKAGILVCKQQGRTLLYSWNLKSKTSEKLKALIGHVYDGLSIQAKAEIFAQRRQPRAKDKPVIT